MATRLKHQHYLSRNDGDFDSDLVPENTGELIIGKDEACTDQVQALGDAIKNWKKKDNWDAFSGTPKDGAPPYVPTEPIAASLLQAPKYWSYGDKVDASNDEFADGCRVFVWRSSQWHPVSAPQLQQIKANLSDGHRVFTVTDEPYSWTVDATENSAWVQIGPSGVRRALRCTPTIFETEDAGPEFLEKIKGEWKDLVGKNEQVSMNTPHMKFDDMMRAFRKKSPHDDDELLFHFVDDLFRTVDISNNSPVTMNNWIHFRLLELQAPSQHAIDQINTRLSAWMEKSAQILNWFVDLFLRSCEGTSSMRLTVAQMKQAVRSWFSQTTIDLFAPHYVEHLNRLLNDDSAFEEGESITYYEYLNFMTGLTWSPVELYYYDLTKGSAWWWTPLLFGQSMPYLWHCGVVVWGKEYRYGGNIFESTPGATAFGTPMKTEKIGMTCRTHQEILSFINRNLAHTFATDSYQVLSNNSNHFCDSLSMFLTNHHISDEVLQQPEVIMRSPVSQSLATWMPWLKGAPLKQTRVNITASREWEDIDENTFVNYEYEDGWSLVARVVAKHEHSCDLSWYSRRDYQFHVRKGVSREAVQPLFGVGSPMHTPCLPQRKF